MDYPKSDATVGLVDGKFTDGNAAQGVPASRDPSAWANLVTDELLNVLTAGAVEPDETNNSQIVAAIQAIITGRFTSNQQLASAGYQQFPGGLLLQWGSMAITSVANSPVSYNWTYPIAFPTNALGAWAVASQNINGTPVISCEGLSTNTFVSGFMRSTDSISRTFRFLAIGN